MKRLPAIILCLLLAGVAIGQTYDETPYRHTFGANCPTGTGVNNVTYSFLARHYDAGMWQAEGNHVRDTANAHGKYWEWDAYLSCQELRLGYAATYPADLNIGWTYEQRMADTVDNPLVVFASGYMAARGKSDSLLFIHYGDDMTSLTQQVGGSRVIDLSLMNTERKRRWCYQNWCNNSSSLEYPNGYGYIANGYNDTTKWALAYAYVMRTYDYAAVFSPDGDTVDGYFMDNQYRDSLGPMGHYPTLPTYYVVDSTRGGLTSWLDWREQPGIRGGITGMEGYDSCTKYHDHSTAMIDSTIKKSLDSMRLITGRKVGISANINFVRSRDLRMVAPYVHSVSLERANEYDWKASWWGEARKFDSIMITDYPGTQIIWQTSVNKDLSTNPAAWNHDSDMVFYANYSFLMCVWDTNATFAVGYYYDTTWWRNIYEVDLGFPVEFAKFGDTTGTGDATKFVEKRRYLKGADTNIVVFRTGPMSQASVNDSILVSLGAYYYRVGVRGDTAGASQNQVWLHPYDGFIGVSNAEPSLVPTISATPTSFTFTGPTGGPNPATQTLYISNSGGGTLNWTLTKDILWLRLGTESGTGSGSSTVEADVTGLEARTYTGTITVTDPAATNNPVTIPVSLEVTQQAPENIVPHSTVQGAKVTGGIWK